MNMLRTCLVAVSIAGLAACATQESQSGAGPRSPNQMKQQELKQMESQGQRNDFDKVKIN